MDKLKKYENCEIVRNISTRECNALGDIKGCMLFKFIDMEKVNLIIEA